MKFLLCFVLCFAAAQAGFLGLGGVVTYSAGVAPAVYSAPLAYSSYVAAAPVLKSYAPVVKSYAVPVVKTYAAPTVYNSFSSPLVKSVYSSPVVYGAPSVYTTLLKK